MSIDLKALIEKQRAELEVVKSESVDVVLGGEKVTLTVEKVHPDVWDGLMQRNPARPGSDSDVEAGYNTKGVTLAYPRLLQDGEVLDEQTRADLVSVLDSTWRNALSIVIWGVNVNGPLSELRALGKARAGRKSPSPAN
jgi:hypothetical protein